MGDDGVPLSFHETFWKSELIDFVILQQDAFDAVDASTPMKRQQYMLSKVLEVADSSFSFNHFEDVSFFFKEIINVFKQMNYSEFRSEKFEQHEKALEEMMQKQVN